MGQWGQTLVGSEESGQLAVGDRDVQVGTDRGSGGDGAGVERLPGEVCERLGAGLRRSALVLRGRDAHDGVQRDAERSAVLLRQEASDVEAARRQRELEALARLGLAVAAVVRVGVCDGGEPFHDPRELPQGPHARLCQQELFSARVRQLVPVLVDPGLEPADRRCEGRPPQVGARSCGQHVGVLDAERAGPHRLRGGGQVITQGARRVPRGAPGPDGCHPGERATHQTSANRPGPTRHRPRRQAAPPGGSPRGRPAASRPASRAPSKGRTPSNRPSTMTHLPPREAIGSTPPDVAPERAQVIAQVFDCPGQKANRWTSEGRPPSTGGGWALIPSAATLRR